MTVEKYINWLHFKLGIPPFLTGESYSQVCEVMKERMKDNSSQPSTGALKEQSNEEPKVLKETVMSDLEFYRRLAGEHRCSLHTLTIKHGRTLEQLRELETRNQKQAEMLNKHDAWFKWFKTQPEHQEVGARWKELSSKAPNSSLSGSTSSE